jgi:hypothetical protein
VQDGVPGDPIVVRLEDRRALRVVDEVRILDPGVREPLGHDPVEARVRRLVDARSAIRALQIEDVHSAGPRERLDLVVVPGAHRVELEA